MSLDKALKQEVERTQEVLLGMNWSDRQLYGQWLSQTYHFVRHTTRLLGLAAGSSTLNEQNYHEQFLYHLKEEHGHELLALKDLRSLGLFLGSELPSTRRFYETTYDSIRSNGGVGLFGYMMFLENLAVIVGGKIADQVKPAFGAKSTRFLSVHAHEDIEHTQVTNQLLESAPQTHLQIIANDLVVAGSHYREILNELSAAETLKKEVA